MGEKVSPVTENLDTFPRDLPNPGMKPKSPTLQADSLPAELQGKPELNAMGRSNGAADKM